MKKSAFFAILALFGCLSCLLQTVFAEPSVSAASAVVMEANSGRVIVAKNAEELRSMASTTKIMTGLLAIESEQLDEVVTVTDEMVRTEGTAIYLQAGEQLSLRTLVYGLLLESGNDAANAIAIALDGSTEAFAARMNRRAAELGMTNTHFVTPSGLDDEFHLTTALDMAKLASAAIRNPEFREIVSQESATVDWISPAKRRTFYNHNRLLREMDGCIGIKTGFTKKSGRCLVTACERNGILLVAVTLSAPDDWQDHCKWMDYAYTQVEKVTLNAAGLDIRVPVVGGAEQAVLLQEAHPVSVVVPVGSRDRIAFRVETQPFIYAPVCAERLVGRVVYTLDDEILAEIPLLTSASVEYQHIRRTGWTQLLRFFRKLFGLNR